MILVTGGTGMVGAHLLYFLLKDNQKIRAIHRKKSDLESVKRIFSCYTSDPDYYFNRIEWVPADITDIPALENAFKGIRKVYHCAAYVSFNPGKYKELKKANIEGTANIVNISLAKNVEKLCYVSSVAALGNAPAGVLATEENTRTGEKKDNVYALTKYGAEMEVWRGTQEGLPAVIVNPGVILGISPAGGGSGAIPAIAARGFPFYPTGGVGITGVEDVVKIMISLMNSEIVNEQFIVVSHNITYQKLLGKLAGYYGKKPPHRKLSRRIMFFLSFLNEVSARLFRTRRVIVKSLVRSMFSTNYYDASKVKTVLNFEFSSLDDILKKTAGTYKKN